MTKQANKPKTSENVLLTQFMTGAILEEAGPLLLHCCLVPGKDKAQPTSWYLSQVKGIP